MYLSTKDEVRNKHVSVNKELNNERLSRNIEKQLYNVCIKQAKEKCMIRKWDNIIFKRASIYLKYVHFIVILIVIVTFKILISKDKIVNGTIKVDDIGKLSVYDIYPENWTELLDKKIKRDKLKYEMKPQAMTDQFKRRKCNSRSCSYYEVQTRLVQMNL